MNVMRRHLSVFLLLCGAGCSALAKTVPVPVVECASDGQSGSRPAPALSRAPDLPIAAASRLAWYDSGNLGVLAPRGWQCLGLYGSNGSILLVAPESARKSPLGIGQPISGQGIELSMSYGSTSGRFEAAKIAAQLFPDRRAFVDNVANESIVPGEAFKKTPSPDDRIHRLGPDQVSFETPANTDGLGTMSRLVKSGEPISGMARIDDDNDVTLLVVRLNSGLRDLAQIILTTTPPR